VKDLGATCGPGKTRQDSDTDFLCAHGSDVGLAVGSPMDFDVRTPRGNPVMSTEAEAPREELTVFETSPGAHTRRVPVGSNEIAIVRGPAGECRRPAGIESDMRSPKHTHADFAGVIYERSVQGDTAQADSMARREVRRDSRVVITKADPAKCSSVAGVELEAELGQLAARVRHHAFAAGLINWWFECIREQYVSSTLPESDSCSQARRTAAHDQYVGCELSHSDDWTLQKAFPKG